MKKRDALFIIFLIIIIFGLYWKTLDYALVWDDGLYFKQNLFFDENKSPAEAFKVGSLREQMGLSNSDLYYRPLLVATFLIENRLWGLNPWTLRLVNLSIYLAALIFFYFFFKSQIPGNHFAEIATLIFALIPLNVDNIVWIVGRGDLMLLLWASLAFLCLERSIKKKNRIYLLGSSFFYLLGIFSKESFLLFLPILWLYDLIKRKKAVIPYHAANILITAGFFFLKNGILRIKGLQIVPYSDPLEIIKTGLGALGYYFRTLAFPISYDLFLPTGDIRRGLYPLAGIAAVLLVVALAVLFKRNKGLYIPLAFIVLFVAGHVPLVITSLFPYQVYSRYMMVPALGLAWLLAYGLCTLKEKLRMSLVLMLLVALIPSVVLNAGVYKTETAFWQHAKRFSPKDAYVDNQLAKTLYDKKDHLKAELILNNSLSLEMRREVAMLISLQYADIEYDRADYGNVERWMESLEGMESSMSIRLAPFIRNHINYIRARVASSQGRVDRAEELLKENIRRYENIRQAYTELYNLYLGHNMWERALEMEKVMRSKFALTYAAYDTLKMKAEFETAPIEKKISFYITYRNFARAIEILSAMGPLNADQSLLLAKLHYWLGAPEQGIETVEELGAREGGNVEILNRIGYFYLQDLFRAKEAVDYFRRSLALKRGQPDLGYLVERLEEDYLKRLRPVWK